MNITLNADMLDLLVDGELHDAARSDLLRLIESTPGGWRRCALAFLEAQEFTNASRAWAADLAPISVPHVEAPQRAKAPTRHRYLLAASAAVVAFLAGFALRGQPTPATRYFDQVTARLDPVPTDAPEVLRVKDQSPPISEYVRSQWERRGYQIEQKQKLISMDLDDGRRVSIPYQDVKVRFVGRPTY